MNQNHDAAPLPRRRDIHRPSGRAFRIPARRATGRGARLGVPAALGVMALSTGLATGVSAATGAGTPSLVRAVTAEPSVGTAPATPSPEASPAPEPTQRTAEPASGVDPEALAAAQATLQRASVLTADAVAVPADQLAKIEQQVAAVHQLLETRDTSGTASRAGERAPLDATPQAAPEAASADPSAQLSEATTSLRTLLDQAASAAVDIEAAPPTPAEILEEQKKAAATAAASLAVHAKDTAGYSNGRIPTAALCELSFAPGQTLRCDAAAQLERLDTAFQAAFGRHLEITDSYRSYSSQVATKASRGYLAAVPGYSNHGWGVAVDLGGGVQSFGTAQYEWLRANAPAFGWDNPDWARPGGKKPEAWHWEYTPLP
ncbi:M15 family metallopeptidase [Isoptericola variabilis]|uniref:Peptidase M15B and M15C DD-carboxypeptidase VanY/endolysin n=1 Tax=Isoptericola variabilis (strain 225) TaxID=743718 RepID=F6FTG1_ISOV2|nr:M15 family metallopeptidase [Isoptericola variabilis]AEG43154.1 peptidase M15B and M15C DD-carboxypeptidase VanY/endolysin [Isoptericola variabilis 225]TWH35085.1 D-alanyl-D-alanine carboxypeptidase [Isoptericola variabilis J7]